MSGSLQTAGRQKLPTDHDGIFQGKLHARVLGKRSMGINSNDSGALYDGVTRKQA
jgi:hypothetical protein